MYNIKAAIVADIHKNLSGQVQFSYERCVMIQFWFKLVHVHDKIKMKIVS